MNDDVFPRERSTRFLRLYPGQQPHRVASSRESQRNERSWRAPRIWACCHDGRRRGLALVPRLGAPISSSQCADVSDISLQKGQDSVPVLSGSACWALQISCNSVQESAGLVEPDRLQCLRQNGSKESLGAALTRVPAAGKHVADQLSNVAST